MKKAFILMFAQVAYIRQTPKQEPFLQNEKNNSKYNFTVIVLNKTYWDKSNWKL
jgi:hypothetical protein